MDDGTTQVSDASSVMKLIGVAMLVAGCGSKSDHSNGEGSGSAQLPKEDMATIPAGTFVAKALQMKPGGDCTAEIAGEPKRDANGGVGVDYWKDEPQRVSTFAIDKQAVSCSDFQLCVEQGGCSAKKKDWSCNDGEAKARLQQAEAFCAWRKRSVPSYLEWQAAVRGPTGISAPDCPASGSGGNRRCVFTSPFGVIVTDTIDSELTRSIECWPALGGEPFGRAPVEVSLHWDVSKTFVALVPLQRLEKHFGGFRCVRD